MQGRRNRRHKLGSIRAGIAATVIIRTRGLRYDVSDFATVKQDNANSCQDWRIMMTNQQINITWFTKSASLILCIYKDINH